MKKEAAMKMADEWNKEADALFANGDPKSVAAGNGLERSADRLREDYGEFPRTNNLGDWRQNNKSKQ